MNSATRRGVGYCAMVFIVVRLAIMVLGYVGTAVIPERGQVSVPGREDRPYEAGPHNLVTALEQQDALWFFRIAEDGYDPEDGSAAFFPLYPLAVRAVSWAIPGGEHPLAAGLLVSNLAFFLALCMLHALVLAERSERVARRTVLYLAIFPTSFFFFAPYSESLFLLLAVTAFWAARRSRWPVAGLAGALAAATRSVGIVLAPALLVEGLHQWREGKRAAHDSQGEGHPRNSLAWRIAWALVPATGLLAYLGFWQMASGDGLAPMHFQALWQRSFVFPLQALYDATGDAIIQGGHLLLDWLLVVPVLVAAGYAVVRLRPSYAVYTWLGILLPLSLVWDPRPLMSMPRFVLVLFPVFWAIAEAVERKRVPHSLVVGLSAGGLGVMTLLFVNSYFVF